jgi:uncharacterized protein with HEPN domain
MTRHARILLGDILEAAELVQRYTAEIAFQEFERDTEKQDAGWALPILSPDVRMILPAEVFWLLTRRA